MRYSQWFLLLVAVLGILSGCTSTLTLRTTALSLLRLTGFQSIRAGLQAVMHDITALLAMARRQPESTLI
jgi:hypothetical protein